MIELEIANRTDLTMEILCELQDAIAVPIGVPLSVEFISFEPCNVGGCMFYKYLQIRWTIYDALWSSFAADYYKQTTFFSTVS